MLRSSARYDDIFGWLIISMFATASPGTEKTWIFQQPFRRLAESEGIESTADTTGTLMSTGAEGLQNRPRMDLGLQRARASMMSEESAKRDSVFGYLIDSMSPTTSQVLKRPDCSKNLFGDSWNGKELQVPLILPGPLMSTGAERLRNRSRTDLEPQRAWISPMSEGSAKRDGIFGCFIVSMSTMSSADTWGTWCFQ